MSVAVGLALTAEEWACWVKEAERKGEGVEVDLAVLRPIVEPMSALSMSADFASVRSSLEVLVLACRVQMEAVLCVCVSRAIILLALIIRVPAGGVQNVQSVDNKPKQRPLSYWTQAKCMALWHMRLHTNVFGSGRRKA